MSVERVKTGGLGAMATIAYRNIWRNGRRTALCVAAVGIAVFFNIFMKSFIEGMMDSIELVVQTFDAGHVNASSELYEEDKEYFPVQFPVADGRDADELVAEIEALPGVRAALPRITSYATLFDSVKKHALLWGVRPDRESAVHALNLSDRGDGLVEGRYPSASGNECAIGVRFARKAGLSIGDRIPLRTVSAQYSDKYWEPRIVGVFELDYQLYDEDVILVSFDRLGRLLSMGGAAQRLFVYLDDPRAADKAAASIEEILGEGQIVRAWGDNYWIAMMEKSAALFVVIFLVFQIVASFLIINTVLMVIHERIKEIGMMGALGMSRREIVLVFFLEAVILSVLGALAGCLIGGAATYAGSLFPIDMDTMSGGAFKDMPFSSTIFMAFIPSALAEGFLFGVVVSAACVLVPSLKSAFVEPVEALRR